MPATKTAVIGKQAMPAHCFLKPNEKKYPVKIKKGDTWVYSKALLLAAARRARMSGDMKTMGKAEAIRTKLNATKSIVSGPVDAWSLMATDYNNPSADLLAFAAPPIDFSELQKAGDLSAVVEDLALSPIGVTDPAEVLSILTERRACVIFLPKHLRGDVNLDPSNLYFLTDSGVKTIHAIVYVARLGNFETAAGESFLDAISEIIPSTESPAEGDLPVALRLALSFDPPVEITAEYTPDETKMIPAHKQIMRACKRTGAQGKPYFPIVQKDGAKRILKLLIAEPGYIDTHDDVSPEATIEAAAHEWMVAWSNPETRPDGQRPSFTLFHDLDVTEKLDPVENYVTDMEMSFTAANGVEQKLAKGSWIMGLKIKDDDLWKKVEAGEIGGASYEGEADALIFDERFVPPDSVSSAAVTES